MESKSPHRGITMHRLPVGGDFPGLVFAVGSALIFLIALPALWVFGGRCACSGTGDRGSAADDPRQAGRVYKTHPQTLRHDFT